MLRSFLALCATLLVTTTCLAQAPGQPGDPMNQYASAWLPILTNQYSVSAETVTETGSSFTIKNRGGAQYIAPVGSFVMDFNWLPQTNQVVNGATYKDNLVVYFGGTGDVGGLMSPNYPFEVQGAVFKLQFTGNRLYLVRIDANQQQTILKEVQLTAANNFPFTFDPPGEYHLHIEVDTVLQTVEVTGRQIGNSATPNDIPLLFCALLLETNEILPADGLMGFYNRQPTAGIGFNAQITALTIDVGAGAPPANGGGNGGGNPSPPNMPPPGDGSGMPGDGSGMPPGGF